MQYIKYKSNNKEYQIRYDFHIITDGHKEIKEYHIQKGKVDLRGNNLDKLIAKLEEKFRKC